MPVLLFRVYYRYAAAAFDATFTASSALLVRSARPLGRTHSCYDAEEQTQNPKACQGFLRKPQHQTKSPRKNLPKGLP